jgi:hypothetical protein
MSDQKDEGFYRKFMGLQQCSRQPLAMTVDDDGLITVSLPDNVLLPDTVSAPLCTLSREEFMEWPSYKILELAGVPVI